LSRERWLILYCLAVGVLGWAWLLSSGLREPLWALLLLFGFWTLGMHAGYAIYFPELFSTRMRSLGAGFCFNSGRIAAAKPQEPGRKSSC